ncbi:tyrosine-type recombinase/integrase [Massilia sp. TSP1-1-2]|uniref:tyrosine-type recombinase/integrase n=1 Tax=Massilia sp. TSP1-1-2 TaxID=2804649 RepID=UPI003CF14F4B
MRRPNLSPRTVRNSRKEAERFLFWIRTRGVTLQTVAYEDLVAYAAFLADPQPAEQWTRAERYARTDARWRPFCGPLSEASQVQALTVLKGLFSWARAAEYLGANPATLLGSMRVVSDEPVSRFLPPAAISLLLAAADSLQADTPAAALRQARARFIVQAFYLTAVRLSELAGADMRSLRRDDAGAWWLHVLGKGRRRGKVPAPPALLAEYRRYRQAYGLAPMPLPGEVMPLVLTSRGPVRRASHSAVASAVIVVMKRAIAMATERGEVELAERIGQASTHWLRHSSLTHQVDSGVPLKTVQKNGRHADISTTGRYLHKEDATRHAETVAAITITPLPAA